MNFKQARQIKNLTAGFTLVELLAVLAIFSMVVSIAGSILFNSLRISNKANIISSARQNGDFITNQLSQSLRDARSITSPFPCVTPIVANKISFTGADGANNTFSCNNSNDNPASTIASNGASLLDNTVKLVDNSCSFTCSQNNLNDYPLIQIKFSLIQSSSSKFTENQASASNVSFSNTVLMRNLLQ